MLSTWWTVGEMHKEEVVVTKPQSTVVILSMEQQKTLDKLLAQVDILRISSMPNGYSSQVVRIVHMYIKLHNNIHDITWEHNEALQAMFEFLAAGALKTINSDTFTRDAEKKWFEFFCQRPDLTWIDESYTRCFSRTIADAHASAFCVGNLRASRHNNRKDLRRVALCGPIQLIMDTNDTHKVRICYGVGHKTVGQVLADIQMWLPVTNEKQFHLTREDKTVWRVRRIGMGEVLVV
jgi:hypothetical protein